jgi:hypothetical protein
MREPTSNKQVLAEKHALRREQPMAKRHVFTVTTPLGYRVRLSRDRWRQITRFKHPALEGCEKQVRKCLEDPDIVRESAKEPNVHLHYNEAGEIYLCVVTAPGDGDDHFVVTAYFTKNIKKGKELWKK